MAQINTVFSMTDNVTNPLRRMNQTVDSTTRGFESMAGKLIGINASLELLAKGFQLVQTASGFLGATVRDAGEYEALLANLTVATGDAIQAEKEFQDLKDFAAKTPFDLPGVVKASTMFHAVGMEAKNIIPTIKMLGDASAGNNEYFNRMAMNYMQIKASGKATMQDMRQFAYMGLPVMQMMQDMGIEGQATAEQVEQMFVKMTSAGGQFYNSMGLNSKTISGQTSNLRDSFQQLSATIGNAVLPLVKEITTATSEFLGVIQETNAFKIFVQKLEEQMNWIKRNLDSIIATVLKVANIVVTSCSVMAVAWAVANWPITLTIALITTVVRIMYNLTEQANETSLEMTGCFNQISNSLSVLLGTLGAIGSFIGGLMNILYNLFATLYNALMTLSEFLYNLFVHPIDAIIGLFVNLGSTIIEVLSSVASVIDYVFGTNLTAGLNKADEKLKAWKENNLKTTNYERAELKDVKGMLSGFQTGADWGAQIGYESDKILSNLRNQIAETNPPEMPEIPLDGQGNIKTSVQNEIKIDDEYKQLLAEKAVREYQLNYSKITPNFTVNNMNISQETDANAVIDIIADGMSELSVTALGVN